jgi:hypothetical protein
MTLIARHLVEGPTPAFMIKANFLAHARAR